MTQIKVAASMNAFSQGRSGSDMVFVEISKRTNMQITLITSLLGKKLCEENGLNLNFLVTTKEEVFSNVLFTYFKRIILGFLYVFRVWGYDIVLGTSDFLPDVIPSFFLRAKSKKSVWIQHIFHIINSERKIPYLMQKLSFRIIKDFADVIVVDNSLLKNQLIQLGFNSEKIHIIYPGINLNYLLAFNEKMESYDGIIMGQLRESKGIFDLVQIWRLVVDEIPTARLGIIGRGNDNDVLKMTKLISDLSLGGNIDVLGFLPNEEAFATIKGSKLCVFPSHEEGFGIVPLECQALGVPVVAWNLPVFEEVFPKGMIKFERGKNELFAQKAVDLLENEKMRLNLAREAVENAKRFSWESTAEQFEKLCKQHIKTN